MGGIGFFSWWTPVKLVFIGDPICSMYGIFTNICPKNHPIVGKYTSTMEHMVIGNLLDICSTIYGWRASTLEICLSAILTVDILVGGDWNMNFMTLPSYWEFHHPNWRTHIFQRGGEKPPTSICILSCMDRGIVVSLHRLAKSLDGWMLQGSCPRKGYPYRWSCSLVWLTFCGIMMFNAYSLIHLSGQCW